eukprot:558110-Alexandrium_andersonii.AAC.1
MSMTEAFSEYSELKGFRGILYGGYKHEFIGIRMEKADAEAVRLRITGKRVALSGERWGIQGIPASLASAAQIEDVLKSSGWADTSVSDIRYVAAK